MSDKPTCAVRGLIRRGAMCSQIISGGKLCGYTGKCEHQRPKPMFDDEDNGPQNDVQAAFGGLVQKPHG